MFYCAMFIFLNHGSTSEIDLLMIHVKGIFVIESKNYSGYIFGSKDQLYWTQSLNKKTKQRFYNPIKQNQTHIKALSEYLGIGANQITSLLVFSERCMLADVPDNDDHLIILKREHLLKYLRRLLRERSIVYSEDEVMQLGRKLKGRSEMDQQEKQEHIDTIKSQQDSLVCPWCGKPLVVRKGKYGPFIGCSGYPKCHYIRKIENKDGLTKINRVDHHKLVRDNIPAIIQKDNKQCITRILQQDEYQVELKKKLVEEANEVNGATTVDDICKELADVMEVVEAIASSYGLTMDTVNETKARKAETNGKFEKRIFLESVLSKE